MTTMQATRKQIASLLVDYSPQGGRLKEPVSCEDIASRLVWEHDAQAEQSEQDKLRVIEEILHEFAAAGFVWMTLAERDKQRMSVCAVFYPYGLRLIA